MNNKIKIKFCGGVGSTTGANFLFESGGLKFLVDCGLKQGGQNEFLSNFNPFLFEPREVKYLFITHAHMDHIGRIPKLIKDGFVGKIYSTKATRDLARVMLTDAFGIMKHDAEKYDKPLLYSQSDLENSFNNWQGFDYYNKNNFEENIYFTFLDAGHVLGSSMIKFEREGKSFVCTGDLGNSPSPLLRDTDTLEKIDYLLTESVYGDRNHENKEERSEKLLEIIKNTISENGVLLIPSFSLERSQVLLYEINEMVENNKIESVDVYFDSPLALKVTDIYRNYTELFNERVKEIIKSGDDIFSFKKLKFVTNFAESDSIHDKRNPKIILGGSGMSSGGRIRNHEKFYLSNPRCTLLFVGYQSVGTLGRKIEEGEKNVVIDGQEVNIKAKIAKIASYSSHKDMEHLISFVESTANSLKKVFVCMGEGKSSNFLSQRLNEYLGVDSVVPTEGDIVEVEF